jgi:hypothetical protein
MVSFNPRSINQAARFDLIAAYFDENRRIPTYRELARMIGSPSTNASFRAIHGMIQAGLLVRFPTPDGGYILVPAGRKVSNKRGKPSGRKGRAPQGRKRKAKQNQQDTKP